MSHLIVFPEEVPLKSPLVCPSFNLLTLPVVLVLIKVGCEHSYRQPIRKGVTALNPTLSNK